MPTVNIIHIVFESWCAFYALVCAIISLSYDTHKDVRGRLLFAVNAVNFMLLVNDALAWYFRGTSTHFGYYMVRISNFFTFFSSFSLVCLASIYIFLAVDKKVVKHLNLWIRSVCIIAGTAIILLIITQFTGLYYYFDSQNYYHRSSFYWLSTALPMCILFMIFVYIIKYRKYLDRFSFVMYMLLACAPIIGLIVMTLVYGISIANILNAILLTLEFMHYEIQRSKNYNEKELEIAQHKMLLAQKDLEIEKSRNRIMLSQIKPHFMFNCLGSIAQLCRINPPRAAEAVDYFSKYLRTNLDSLDVNAPVPFTTELSHIRAYMWLEKMRFGDDLEFVEEIETESFFLPILSVQPLVENAVKHGLAGLEEGVLTVTLRTEETDREYIITVSDNGNGFDMTAAYSDGRSHIGMKNVVQRITEMMHGTCEVQSRIGEGTTAKIVIPKK